MCSGCQVDEGETCAEDGAEGESSRVQLFGSSEGSVPLCTLSRQHRGTPCQAAPEQLQTGCSTGSFLSRLNLSQQMASERSYGAFFRWKQKDTHLKEALMLLCGSQNNLFSSLILTVLTETMFTTTAVKCAAVSDQGNPV